jgi:uncharacterized protein (TIGR03435 family)
MLHVWESAFVRYSAMKVLLIILALTVAASGAAFDVASVKLNTGGTNNGSMSGGGGSTGRITVENFSLREIVFYAFGVAWGRDYSVQAPAWLDSEKFDMIATFPKGTSRDGVQAMMQALLVERFGLKAHRENRKLESYVLVVDKKGAKLKPNTDGAESGFTWGEDRVTCRAISVAGLADRLSGPVFKLGRPVVDMTGLKGVFDFTLNWAPDNMLAEGHSGASIFTALEEQLGLRLTARKTAFSILVIDHMEKIPTGN